MSEAASAVINFSSEFVVTEVSVAALTVALLLLALKDENAKKMVSRHTMDVGKKIFFTDLGFFEVIGKRCGDENIMHKTQIQAIPLIFSTAEQN
ncbi:MAG: hypothetical protein EOO10_05075 [Chitinophagaceae bacterium]|nr:MAG: hypothetical protein EOO10_05075 [Chitinophagaceae bacterium]